MLSYSNKMVKQIYKPQIKFEDIMFWIIIAGLIGITLWMFHGSPTEIGAIIGIGTFAAASDILIWKKVFSIDKNTTLGFMKVKHDIEKLNININNRFDRLENQLGDFKK